MNKAWLNWKVLVVLVGAAGVGLYVVAPSVVVATLPILALVACPLAMLLMMKGMHGTWGESEGQQTPQETDAALTREEQIIRLRWQQAALADRIKVLEQDEPPTGEDRERTAGTGESS